MTTLQCKCGYRWPVPDGYREKYGEAGSVCPGCGGIGVEVKIEKPEFYEI